MARAGALDRRGGYRVNLRKGPPVALDLVGATTGRLALQLIEVGSIDATLRLGATLGQLVALQIEVAVRAGGSSQLGRGAAQTIELGVTMRGAKSERKCRRGRVAAVRGSCEN